MGRLIDADALIDRIPNKYEQAEVARWVNEMPTIVPERKKGRWVYLSSVHGIDTSTRTYSYPFCSECGREHPVANFCSNCGADMRGGE